MPRAQPVRGSVESAMTQSSPRWRAHSSHRRDDGRDVPLSTAELELAEQLAMPIDTFNYYGDRSNGAYSHANSQQKAGNSGNSTRGGGGNNSSWAEEETLGTKTGAVLTNKGTFVAVGTMEQHFRDAHRVVVGSWTAKRAAAQAMALSSSAVAAVGEATVGATAPPTAEVTAEEQTPSRPAADLSTAPAAVTPSSSTAVALPPSAGGGMVGVPSTSSSAVSAATSSLFFSDRVSRLSLPLGPHFEVPARPQCLLDAAASRYGVYEDAVLSFWGVWFVVAAATRFKRPITRKRQFQEDVLVRRRQKKAAAAALAAARQQEQLLEEVGRAQEAAARGGLHTPLSNTTANLFPSVVPSSSPRSASSSLFRAAPQLYDGAATLPVDKDGRVIPPVPQSLLQYDFSRNPKKAASQSLRDAVTHSAQQVKARQCTSMSTYRRQVVPKEARAQNVSVATFRRTEPLRLKSILTKVPSPPPTRQQHANMGPTLVSPRNISTSSSFTPTRPMTSGPSSSSSYAQSGRSVRGASRPPTALSALPATGVVVPRARLQGNLVPNSPTPRGGYIATVGGVYPPPLPEGPLREHFVRTPPPTYAGEVPEQDEMGGEEPACQSEEEAAEAEGTRPVEDAASSKAVLGDLLFGAADGDEPSTPAITVPNDGGESTPPNSRRKSHQYPRQSVSFAAIDPSPETVVPMGRGHRHTVMMMGGEEGGEEGGQGGGTPSHRRSPQRASLAVSTASTAADGGGGGAFGFSDNAFSPLHYSGGFGTANTMGSRANSLFATTAAGYNPATAGAGRRRPSATPAVGGQGGGLNSFNRAQHKRVTSIVESTFNGPAPPQPIDPFLGSGEGAHTSPNGQRGSEAFCRFRRFSTASSGILSGSQSSLPVSEGEGGGGSATNSPLRHQQSTLMNPHAARASYLRARRMRIQHSSNDVDLTNPNNSAAADTVNRMAGGGSPPQRAGDPLLAGAGATHAAGAPSMVLHEDEMDVVLFPLPYVDTNPLAAGGGGSPRRGQVGGSHTASSPSRKESTADIVRYPIDPLTGRRQAVSAEWMQSARRVKDKSLHEGLSTKMVSTLEAHDRMRPLRREFLLLQLSRSHFVEEEQQHRTAKGSASSSLAAKSPSSPSRSVTAYSRSAGIGSGKPLELIISDTDAFVNSCRRTRDLEEAATVRRDWFNCFYEEVVNRFAFSEALERALWRIQERVMVAGGDRTMGLPDVLLLFESTTVEDLSEVAVQFTLCHFSASLSVPYNTFRELIEVRHVPYLLLGAGMFVYQPHGSSGGMNTASSLD